MKVLQLPITKKMGITKSNNNKYLLQLNYHNKILNHVDTIHATALYSLAEITSGYYLNKEFKELGDTTFPVLRSSCIKYKKKCTQNIYSKATLKNGTLEDILLQLKFKRKCIINIEVKLYNEDNVLSLTSDFEWFVILIK